MMGILGAPGEGRALARDVGNHLFTTFLHFRHLSSPLWNERKKVGSAGDFISNVNSSQATCIFIYPG